MGYCTFCRRPADAECQCCGDARCAQHIAERNLGDDAAMACHPACDPIELSPLIVSEMRQDRILSDRRLVDEIFERFDQARAAQGLTRNIAGFHRGGIYKFDSLKRAEGWLVSCQGNIGPVSVMLADGEHWTLTAFGWREAGNVDVAQFQEAA